jgi:replication factor A1
MLSKDAIANIYTNKATSNKDLSLQILSTNQDLARISNTQQLLLSDGNWQKSFKVLGSLCAQIPTKLRQFDVISVNLVFNPRTKLGTITRFSILESGVNSSIGSPQNVENYENIQRINEARSGRAGRYKAQDEEEDDCMEIANLTPYDNDWKIKGRVIKKTQKRNFKKRDGSDGCVFNIHILDENNDRIQGVFFTEAANEFHDRLQVGKIFHFKGGDIKKVKNPRYNTTGNDLEIFFNLSSRITEISESDIIPQFFYKFIKLSELETTPENETVDVLALVHKVGDAEDITLRSGESRKRRNIELIDDTGVVCSLTLWGETAMQINPNKNEIIGFSELKVRDFRGKQLSFSFNSKVIEDNLRDLPLYRQLMAERNRGVKISKNISQTQFQKYVCKKIRQIDQECKAILNDNYESKETKLYYNLYGYISFVKEKISYPSCHNDNCKKKVIKNFTEQYNCERCNQNYDEPKCKILFYFNF